MEAIDASHAIAIAEWVDGPSWGAVVRTVLVLHSLILRPLVHMSPSEMAPFLEDCQVSGHDRYFSVGKKVVISFFGYNNNNKAKERKRRRLKKDNIDKLFSQSIDRPVKSNKEIETTVKPQKKES